MIFVKIGRFLYQETPDNVSQALNGMALISLIISAQSLVSWKLVPEITSLWENWQFTSIREVYSLVKEMISFPLTFMPGLMFQKF